MTARGVATLVAGVLVALVTQGASVAWGAVDGSFKWHSLTGYLVESSPALASDGTLYVGNRANRLLAITPTGSLKWPFTAGSWIDSTPAIGTDGTIYVGSYDFNLYALAPGNGSQKWAFPTGGIIYSSPALGSDGTIYVGSEDGSLYAIAPSGAKLWSYKTGGAIDSSPAIGSDGTIYVGSLDHALYAVAPDGRLKWTFPTGDGIVAPPAIGADGTIYVGSKDSHLYALTPGGNSKWSATTGGAIETSPAIGPTGTIYFASLDANLYAVTSDGSPLWNILPSGSAKDPIYSSPAVRSDGTIVLGAGTYDENNPAQSTCQVVAVNSDSSIKWRYGTPDNVDSSPVIGPDGTIYVGCWDGNLYALNGDGAGPATSSWPLFHQNLARVGRAVNSGTSAANPGRLLNLSVLDSLSAVNPMMTVGFVTGGTGTAGTEPVLIRAIGPALSAFLSGPLVANPALTVFSGPTVLAGNDNWASTPANQLAVTNADALVYAFPLTDPSSLDAALVLTLAPSPGYTAQIQGAPTGAVLAEVYDATPAGTYQPTSPRLINLSCLATLQSGGLLTAGFIIGGSSPETVLIRATGPALASLNLGVGNPMSDPRLTLHTSIAGQDQVLATNVGWTAIPQTVSSIVFDSRSVGAFALDASSQDSVLLTTLAPGAYTAEVRSNSGGGGAALIEVYEIP